MNAVYVARFQPAGDAMQLSNVILYSLTVRSVTEIQAGKIGGSD
jgi:hypothetical protein